MIISERARISSKTNMTIIITINNNRDDIIIHRDLNSRDGFRFVSLSSRRTARSTLQLRMVVSEGQVRDVKLFAVHPTRFGAQAVRARRGAQRSICLSHNLLQFSVNNIYTQYFTRLPKTVESLLSSWASS